MEKTVNAVTIMRSMRDSIRELPEPEQLPTLWAIMDYAMDGVQPNMTDMSRAQRAIIIMALPIIDKANKRRVDGARGGYAAKHNQVAKQSSTAHLGANPSAPLYVPPDDLRRLQMQAAIDKLR